MATAVGFDVTAAEKEVARIESETTSMVWQLQEEAKQLEDAYWQTPEDDVHTRRQLANDASACRNLIWRLKTAGQGNIS